MSFSLPTLDLSSPLVQTGLAKDRFHVTQYMRDGLYPEHRAEKDEAEAYVASVIAAIDRGEATQLVDELQHYLRAMFHRTSWSLRVITSGCSCARSDSRRCNEPSTTHSTS